MINATNRIIVLSSKRVLTASKSSLPSNFNISQVTILDLIYKSIIFLDYISGIKPIFYYFSFVFCILDSCNLPAYIPNFITFMFLLFTISSFNIV